MTLLQIGIEGFRNLHHVSFGPGPGLNVVVGANAAGKTSLLEAIHYLGRGRSFRTRNHREMIARGAGSFRIVARLQGPEGPLPLGLERSPEALVARLSGRPLSGLAELARCLPLLLLNPDSHGLLEDGPAERRRFMDWGLFHAEPAFLTAWRRYGTALKHRNAALRAGMGERAAAAWEGELAAAAQAIDPMREGFCRELEQAVGPRVHELLGMAPPTIEYRRGWARGNDLASLLAGGREQDRRQGHTRFGPHRADFGLLFDGQPPRHQLSRGQQKLLVVALVLALGEQYRRLHGAFPLLLVDDLPSELDATHLKRVNACLARVAGQVFVTAIEPQPLDLAPWSHASSFRIESGRLTG